MWQKVLLSILLLILTIWLGYFINQSAFEKLIIGFVPFFIIYLLVFHKTKSDVINSSNNISFWLGLGIFLRIVLVFSFPNLSDDIYRFYWDGLLSTHGYNPFDYLPDYYIQNNILSEYLTPELYYKLNSKDHYTIYPPILQAVFAIAAWLSPKNIIIAGIIMKLFLLLSEIGSILLIKKILQKFKLPEKNILLYALNPLIIVEIVGNLHFEGFMIFFLLLSLWFFINNRFTLSAFAMAGAIASKLLPLMFLPFLIARLGWRRSIIYFLIIALTLLALFIPLINSLFFENFGNSLNLYFRQFQFNASVFYLIKWFNKIFFGEGYIIKTVGPILAMITFSCIIILTIIRKNKDLAFLPESWLFAISIYLLNTPIVHPWYITLPVALSVFTNWRYPIIWSGVVWLSYSHYWGGGFQENYGLIGVEYGILIIFFLLELFRNNR
ncbi:MAG: glycosyltransferase 87 family protein [Saprospiraceae bacterium]|nr:glycosyltransferase 87 family protein [Saprospiraceae bacterium]